MAAPPAAPARSGPGGGAVLGAVVGCILLLAGAAALVWRVRGGPGVAKPSSRLAPRPGHQDLMVLRTIVLHYCCCVIFPVQGQEDLLSLPATSLAAQPPPYSGQQLRQPPRYEVIWT